MNSPLADAKTKHLPARATTGRPYGCAVIVRKALHPLRRGRRPRRPACRQDPWCIPAGCPEAIPYGCAVIARSAATWQSVPVRKRSPRRFAPRDDGRFLHTIGWGLFPVLQGARGVPYKITRKPKKLHLCLTMEVSYNMIRIVSCVCIPFADGKCRIAQRTVRKTGDLAENQ